MTEEDLSKQLVQLYLHTQAVIALTAKGDYVNAEMNAYDLENIASELKNYLHEKWLNT